MEHLTERNENGFAMPACCRKCGYNYCCEVGGFSSCKGIDDIIDRLADIEDILGDNYNLDDLQKLMKSENQHNDLFIKAEQAENKANALYAKETNADKRNEWSAYCLLMRQLKRKVKYAEGQLEQLISDFERTVSKNN